MQVGIVGAGYSGLITARILREVGIDVVVHEAAPDVGGVWSRTRQYPGLTTQNDKVTYAVSDFPMPESYPTYPAGPQVGAYLERYVEAFGLRPLLRLSSEVVRAEPTPGGGWSLTTRDETGASMSQQVDHLVVANGVYCEPHVPRWPGRDEYESAGGQVRPPSAIPDTDPAHGRNVVVVGYGKSACDISVPLSDVASSMTTVTRELLWKMPKRIEDLFEYKYALFTRLGENLLFRYLRLRGVARFLHGIADPLRRRVVAAIQKSATQQLGLRALDLEPSRPFAETGPGRGSLVSDGFLERVADGRIDVVHGDSVAALGVRDGQPCVHLASGRTVAADMVVAGTGFEQRVPFLPPNIIAELTDERGAFRLFRTVLPVGVPQGVGKVAVSGR
jgi:dimethylaniline monooxygenase (N-oxide forming)